MRRDPDAPVDLAVCADPAGIDAAIEIITAAFADDPGMRRFVGNSAEPDRLRRSIVEAIVRAHIAAGEPAYLLTWKGEPAGAALVDVSRAPMRMVLGVLKTWTHWLRLPLTSIWRLIASLARSRAGSDTTSNYLVMVGIRPEMQGLGLGGTFVRMLEQTVRPGRGWSLDTENEANVRFYEKLGFSRVNTVDWAGLTIHQMHKPGV